MAIIEELIRRAYFHDKSNIMIDRRFLTIRCCFIKLIVLTPLIFLLKDWDSSEMSLGSSMLNALYFWEAKIEVFKSDLLVSGSPMNSSPTEAFVTFSNNEPKYLNMLSSLLDSVHEFSTRPIIVYGIDVDIDLETSKYPRLIKRKLNKTNCRHSIFFCKIHAMVESRVDYGVQLEADSIVNWNVDVLFDVIRKWPYPFPIAPRHPTDPMNYHKFLRQIGLNMKTRTTPYVHAQFSWNYRAYPFLRQALSLMQKGHFIGANYDETAINLLLWKARSNHTLCKIDPFFTYLTAYEEQKTVCKDFCHTAFILIHGSKKNDELKNIFARLKNHVGLPYIQTPMNGFHHLNETEYTCCYPDSRQSAIHPLLCEYN